MGLKEQDEKFGTRLDILPVHHSFSHIVLFTRYILLKMDAFLPKTDTLVEYPEDSLQAANHDLTEAADNSGPFLSTSDDIEFYDASVDQFSDSSESVQGLSEPLLPPVEPQTAQDQNSIRERLKMSYRTTHRCWPLLTHTFG